LPYIEAIFYVYSYAYEKDLNQSDNLRLRISGEWLGVYNFSDFSGKFLKESIELYDIVLETVNEFFGYFKAKKEERARNIKSVSSRTKKRLKNIELIREMLSDHDFKVNRKIVIKAMEKTDRGERTVKEMIKEVIKKGN